MTWTRRDFLQLTLGTGVGFGLSASVLPSWLTAAVSASDRDRMLVVLELTGGNDALNMVIPHGDDIYHRSRPRLRVPPSEVLRIDEHFGLHPRMDALGTRYAKTRRVLAQFPMHQP